MARVAILGGGIAGLAAAFQCERERLAGHPVDWHLFEASDVLGRTVSTTRIETADGEYILEDGPDGWLTEKPWARELAEELGLGDEIIGCNEADKKTYLWFDDRLVPMPERMRLMVPEDLRTLDNSSLFSARAKAAYHEELSRGKELMVSAPETDESVASFVQRHFGQEVLEKIAAPLLSGVFGGDVHKLSVCAVMPSFVTMEAEHGSLIAAVQRKARERASKAPQPTFTSLRRGMGSLVEALVAALPADRVHRGNRVAALGRSPKGEWLVRFTGTGSASCAVGFVSFDDLFLAVPAETARDLLSSFDAFAASLIPTEASSAVLATFVWPPDRATFPLPEGFGFLVPKQPLYPAGNGSDLPHPQLLAGTFTAQKFAERAPAGAKIVRVFFSGHLAENLASEPDSGVAQRAFAELSLLLPGLPEPEASFTTVRRWPRSLPQYKVGHLDRMAELNAHIQALGHLHLLGNGYRGVGVPDLIRDARSAARTLTQGT